MSTLEQNRIGNHRQAANLYGYAASLNNWELPQAFSILLTLLEVRHCKTGKLECVQVLHLLERFEMDVLHCAFRDALQKGAVSL